MRIGFMGLGRIGAFHAETLAGLDAVDSLVVTDPVAAAVATATERFGATATDSPVTPTLLSDAPASPVPSHQPSAVSTSRFTFTSDLPVPYPTRAALRPLTAAATAVEAACLICSTYCAAPVPLLAACTCGAENVCVTVTTMSAVATPAAFVMIALIAAIASALIDVRSSTVRAARRDSFSSRRIRVVDGGEVVERQKGRRNADRRAPGAHLQPGSGRPARRGGAGGRFRVRRLRLESRRQGRRRHRCGHGAAEERPPTQGATRTGISIFSCHLLTLHIFTCRSVEFHASAKSIRNRCSGIVAPESLGSTSWEKNLRLRVAYECGWPGPI